MTIYLLFVPYFFFFTYFLVSCEIIIKLKIKKYSQPSRSFLPCLHRIGNVTFIIIIDDFFFFFFLSLLSVNVFIVDINGFVFDGCLLGFIFVQSYRCLGTAHALFTARDDLQRPTAIRKRTIVFFKYIIYLLCIV